MLKKTHIIVNGSKYLRMVEVPKRRTIYSMVRNKDDAFHFNGRENAEIQLMIFGVENDPQWTVERHTI